MFDRIVNLDFERQKLLAKSAQAEAEQHFADKSAIDAAVIYLGAAIAELRAIAKKPSQLIKP